MGSSSCSRKTLKSQIYVECNLVCSREQRKNKCVLKDFLVNVGECVSGSWRTVINGLGWVFTIPFEIETVHKCLLAENINICPKHFKISWFQNSIRLICYFCIIFVAIFPFVRSSELQLSNLSWLLLICNGIISILCWRKRVRNNILCTPTEYFATCFTFCMIFTAGLWNEVIFIFLSEQT